jgi:hypothetical protein
VALRDYRDLLVYEESTDKTRITMNKMRQQLITDYGNGDGRLYLNKFRMAVEKGHLGRLSVGLPETLGLRMVPIYVIDLQGKVLVKAKSRKISGET